MKINKGFLVTFSGIDGSGKTTLAKSLVDSLNKKGFRSKYVYGRLEPFFSKPFILISRNLFLKKVDPFKDYELYSNKRREIVNRHLFLFKIYAFILVLDYSLQLMMKIRLPLTSGNDLVCDRYIYDTIVNDISINMEHSEIKEAIGKFFYIFPRPNLAFLIDIPEETAFQRKNDIPSLEYLREKRNFFLEIGKDEKMMILDGSEKLSRLIDFVQEMTLREANK